MVFVPSEIQRNPFRMNYTLVKFIDRSVVKLYSVYEIEFYPVNCSLCRHKTLKRANLSKAIASRSLAIFIVCIRHCIRCVSWFLTCI